MPDLLLATASSLRSQLEGFEAGQFTGIDCARLAEELAATEKACAAVRIMASARAIEQGAHESRGFRHGPAWVAHQSGATTSQARQALDAAAALGDCPATKAALLAGELSWTEASEITKAEEDVPGTEAILLDTARKAGLGALRDKAREQRLANASTEVLHRRQHRARHFRHWRDHLGMVRFTGALPPETGVPLVRRVELAAQRLRRSTTPGEGRREPFDALAADALVAVTSGAGNPTSPRAELVVVCDINAWRRGHAHGDEVCHIVGGSPIPTEVAKQLAEDAFLKAVLHDGVAVHTVKHFGRHIPAELRTALDLGPAPAFAGTECVDCGRRFGLEYDHVDPVANHGPTSLANLRPRCWPDHRAKTERDRQAGLLGPSPPRRRAGVVGAPAATERPPPSPA